MIVEQRVSEDVACTAVDLKHGSTGVQLAAQREGGGRVDEGEHRAGRGAACERQLAPPARELDAHRQLGVRRRLGAELGDEVDALVTQPHRCALGLQREHAEAARPAVFGFAEAPVAQAVGQSLEVHFTVAQHDATDDHALGEQGRPREFGRELAERGEGLVDIGPRHVGDAHAVHVQHRIEFTVDAEPHRFENDAAAR